MINNIVLVWSTISWEIGGLITGLFILVGYLTYKLYAQRKSNKKGDDYQHFLFDLLDNLPFPVMAKDVKNDFRYAYWNKESEMQSGIPHEKAIGFSDIDIYGKERGHQYRKIDEKLVKRGKVYRAEESYITEDGIRHDTWVMKSVISWKDTYQWLLVTRWDISQLKEYSRELAASKEELEKAINKQNLALRSIDFGLIYLDKDYRVQWEETTSIKELAPGRRYIPGEICYRTSSLQCEPCKNCAFKEAIETGNIVKHTVRIDNKVDFEVTATPVYDDKREQIIGGLLRLEDITEKVKTAELLQEAKEKAEESNRLKSAFLANMSHEIRTPLNAIIGFSDMICQEDDLEDKQEYRKIISANNELLLQLIDDILDLSKIEAGTMECTLIPTDINEMMENIYHQMLQKNPSTDVVIEFTEKEPECIIETDRRRISQVIINFINNAMKFTKQGSISMGYHLEPSKEEIYFFVRDTGIGIAEKNLDQIFERFVKLNSFVKGTGLGLAICRVIIERLGGTIGVDSKEGEGSCFWFRLPVKIPRASSY